MRDRLEKLRSKDISKLGYQYKIEHKKQIDDLEKEMLNKDVERVLDQVKEEGFAKSKARTEEYIKTVLKQVEEIWIKVPHLRLGQLLGNCTVSELSTYYVEDDVLLKKMDSIYNDRKGRLT